MVRMPTIKSCVWIGEKRSFSRGGKESNGAGEVVALSNQKEAVLTPFNGKEGKGIIKWGGGGNE